MNNKRDDTNGDMKTKGYDSSPFVFPEGEGEFTGTLVMTSWTKKLGLLCHFRTDDGKLYKLIAYWNPRHGDKYTAKDNDIDMSKEPMGAKFKIHYSSIGKHYTVWKSCVRCE